MMKVWLVDKIEEDLGYSDLEDKDQILFGEGGVNGEQREDWFSSHEDEEENEVSTVA